MNAPNCALERAATMCEQGTGQRDKQHTKTSLLRLPALIFHSARHNEKLHRSGKESSVMKNHFRAAISTHAKAAVSREAGRSRPLHR